MNTKNRFGARLLAISILLFGLAGCASFSTDGGFSAIEQTATKRIGKEVRWAKTDTDRAAITSRVAALLKYPLSVDDAVQIALLNNAGMQAAFAELGLAEADVVQAGRIPNPHFTM